MNAKQSSDPDFDPTKRDVRDTKGARVTPEYLEQVSREAEAGYDLEVARKVGRPPLSGAPEA